MEVFEKTPSASSTHTQPSPIGNRITGYLDEILPVIKNRFAEQSAAADALNYMFARDFRFDYQDYISGSLRLPKIQSDQRENYLFIQIGQDYATTVGELNKAIEDIEKHKSLPNNWSKKTAAKFTPGIFSRIQNGANESRYRTASQLDKKADQIIENARKQQDAFLLRAKENQDTIEKVNTWLARIDEESRFLSQFAKELGQNNVSQSTTRERDAIDLTLAKVQTILQDLYIEHEKLRTLRNSLRSLDESNKEASSVFSKILTLRRLDFKSEAINADPSGQANERVPRIDSDKNLGQKNKENLQLLGWERPIPEGVKIASLFDLQRRLIIGEQVFVASEKSEKGLVGRRFDRGNSISVATEPKSYFLTIYPLTFLDAVFFNPVSKILQGQLPAPVFSYVGVKYYHHREGTGWGLYDYQLPRQELAIATTGLIYGGFRVGDVFRSPSAIEGLFTVRGFTYWGDLLLSHILNTQNGGIESWHVYSPRTLRKRISKGVLIPYILNNAPEKTISTPALE